MLRNSPADYYIKYLVVHPAGYDNNKIRDILRMSQLDYIGNEHLDRMRDLVQPPDPFYPYDLTHKKSQRFLIKERIAKLFQRDEATEKAFSLLDSPRAKEFLESMTLAGAPLQAIAVGLHNQTKFSCSVRALEQYLHFFWNLDLVDSTEIRTILAIRGLEEVRDGDFFEAAKAKAKERAGFQDPRKIAAELPNNPLVALLSQMRMGIMPKSIDLALALDATQKAATLRSLEASLRGGFEDHKKAVDFIMVARTAGEMLETVVKPDEKLREQLSAIALTTETRTIPTLGTLSAGAHTTDTGPPLRVTHGDGDSD